METKEILKTQLKELEYKGEMDIELRIKVLEKMHLLLYLLVEEKEEDELNDVNKCREIDYWAREILEAGLIGIKGKGKQVKKLKIVEWMKECYQVLGRRHFEDFLIAIEWNYKPENKFYDIRKNVLKDWVGELEKLELGEYKGLSISAPPRTGKALRNGSKVLIEDGEWKAIEELKEGDLVIGADGKPAEVLGVFPQGKKEIYRITFDDDTYVDCSPDHLWEIVEGKEVIDTREIIERLKRNEETNIRLMEPMEKDRFINRRIYNVIKKAEMLYMPSKDIEGEVELHRRIGVWAKKTRGGYYVSNKRKKKIEKVEYIGEDECTCIYVNNEDHLFVTEGYTVTHNTAIGTMFFLWCGLRHPDKSCFFVSHTASVAYKIYNDICGMLEDEKREITKIFPRGKITQKNAEQNFIQLETDSSNPYHTFYFRGIDGNMAGVLEASWLLYCDDLIKNIEEAMNPDRLETARTKYGTDIRQRKSNKEVRELHIATRWSTGDVISTLENNHKNDPKWKFIKKPALDENGKSNFMYKHPYEMDEEYFLEQRNSPMMDEIAFSCLYQQEPIERDGLWVTEDKLNYFNGELPDGEPDLICAACDVAWGGGDYLSMPIAKVYGTAVYIVDIVYHNGTKEVTRPYVAEGLMKNKVQKVEFEANNGGDEYCDRIKDRLAEKGYRMEIKSAKAPTNKSKTSRIISVTDEVLGISPEYQLYFLEERKRNNMYRAFMKHLLKYNTSMKFVDRQKDDCADSLAILVTKVLESRVTKAKAQSNYSRKDLRF